MSNKNPRMELEKILGEVEKCSADLPGRWARNFVAT
jgi:hypothetical protein